MMVVMRCAVTGGLLVVWVLVVVRVGCVGCVWVVSAYKLPVKDLSTGLVQKHVSFVLVVYGYIC